MTGRGVEWTAVEALQAAQRAVAELPDGTGSAERVMGRRLMRSEAGIVIERLREQAERDVEWVVKS